MPISCMQQGLHCVQVLEKKIIWMFFLRNEWNSCIMSWESRMTTSKTLRCLSEWPSKRCERTSDDRPWWFGRLLFPSSKKLWYILLLFLSQFICFLDIHRPFNKLKRIQDKQKIFSFLLLFIVVIEMLIIATINIMILINWRELKLKTLIFIKRELISVCLSLFTTICPSPPQFISRHFTKSFFSSW